MLVNFKLRSGFVPCRPTGWRSTNRLSFELVPGRDELDLDPEAEGLQFGAQSLGFEFTVRVGII